MTARFEQFTVLINGISRCIHKLKTKEMAEFNLKSSHVSCLYYLYQEKTLSATELCEICGEDKANMSRSLRYLEENGYLMCESAAKKRYQSAFMLTEKGTEIACRIAEKIDRILSLASAELGEDDRAAMYQSLTLIHRNLSRLCDGEALG
ncbi:MAG: transcriptional regulator [Clostridia bacterium]|nr:transcriptional regulator [Clostridia bacterium]